MKQTTIFNTHTAAYEAWYNKYPQVYLSEFEAIKEQFQKLPKNIKGVEIGLGTGRFSQLLGIKEGVEPSEEMAALAAKKGIEVIQGTAENVPYKDLSFDFVLFVTICHLGNFKEALIESDRGDVNHMMFNIFATRQLGGGWYVNSAPIITADWTADSDDRWVVPIGAGGGKLVMLSGKLPLNLQTQLYYNVVQPDFGPE